MPKCIVIGGGFGGIASALRMRAKGYDVTLIDKQDKLGGRGYQYNKETEHGVFVHDAGPTVITAKFLFDELFELFGKKREDYVEFRDIYPWYRIQFADGSTFDYGGTMEQFEGQIRKFGGDRDVEGFRKYLAHSKRIFDKGFTELGDQPFDKFTTMLRCAPDLVRLGCYKTVYQMGAKYIKNEKLRRVFSFQPLLVGGNPFNTTCIYSLIFYLEREWGVQFAMGGTGAIVRGLEKLMEEEGIQIRLREEVTRLGVFDRKHIETLQEDLADFDPNKKLVRDGLDLREVIAAGGLSKQLEAGAAQSVGLASGERVPVSPKDGDIVVINGDPPHVYRELVPENQRPKLPDVKIDKLHYSMGLFVLYFGTTKPYDDVAHHTIVLGEAYRELIDKLFETRDVEREDLSVYLHRPTATDPSMAPEGMDSFYVLVPVPNLVPKKKPDGDPAVPMKDGAIDWAAFGDAFRDDVVRYLERTCLPGLSDCITGDFYVTPEHFRDNLNTHFGSGFSVQPIFRQSAWFRFHNKSDIDGLYFVGAGTHPGAGMPGVLCSAKVVDNLIDPVASPTPADAAAAGA